MGRFKWPIVNQSMGSTSGAVQDVETGATPVFIGFGLIRPFQRDMKSDFASAGGERLVRSSVGQILGTKAQGERAFGELPWRPDFGSKFYLLKFKKDPVLSELARVYAQESLRRWEPRIRISSVRPVFSRDRREMRVRIKFDVIDVNVPGNNVLIPSLETEVPV